MEKKFTLKQLPYDYDALEPVIDKETVMIHHDRHQQTYVDNLNKALDKHPELFNMSLVDIIKNLDDIPKDIEQAVINNAGGVFNHEFYWDGLTSNKNKVASEEFKKAIDSKFGSCDDFLAKLKEAALGQFGSGWAWLVLNENKELEIMSTPNQNNPMSLGKIPLLTVDVWEHAYYLKYQNKRADYVSSLFDIINWNVVSERFEKAMK